MNTYADLKPGDCVVTSGKTRKVTKITHDIRPGYHYVIVELAGLKSVIAMPATEQIQTIN